MGRDRYRQLQTWPSWQSSRPAHPSASLLPRQSAWPQHPAAPAWPPAHCRGCCASWVHPCRGPGRTGGDLQAPRNRTLRPKQLTELGVGVGWEGRCS